MQSARRDTRLGLDQGLPCGRLVLKLATTPAELQSVLKLRFKIFNEELGEGIPENAGLGLDVDEFDKHCDHLMVLDHGKVVGTYRLLHGPRRPEAGFYSQTEFDLSRLHLDIEHTVELGRGCIDPEHRKQTTLMALFWGLDKYMLSRGAKHLIGCSSLPLMSADDAEATYAKLAAENHTLPNALVQPLPANQFRGDATRGTPNVPPLASFYVAFGAKILGRPAYDPIFRCYDLFMHFDLDHLSTWGQELLDRFDRRLAAASTP
ncbi:MAG: GNAT family N-acetyltransferase [Bdellovibrionales bacterium]|nr:GNAT family N-acetyltransferase [Bdellovibrionales bacterium]